MTLESLLKYPLVFLLALLAVLLATPLWVRIAPALGFLDRPGHRKIHPLPIPVGGGVAVFIGFHAACALVFLFPWQPFAGQVSVEWWQRFLPLSACVVLLGLLDDRFDVPPLLKLAGQLGLAVAAYLLEIRVQNILGVALPGWFDFAATVIWFLLLMNSFNLIDGIDGLATGIAVIASFGIALSLVFRNAPGDVLLFLGLAGAGLGFLRYNFYPARVFLGDTGSMFIGFALASLAISTSSKGPAMAAIGMPMLAVGVPLFDTLLAVWRRSVRHVLAGESRGALMGIDQGDAEHLHHRLLRGGRDHSQVALLLYGATALLASFGILASVFHDRAMGILGLAFLLGAYTIVRHLAGIELLDSGRAVLHGLARPVRRNRTLLFYVLADVAILNTALFVSAALMHAQGEWGPLDLKRLWIKAAPLDVGLPFLLLVLFRAYSRVWYLAHISEYVFTGLAVVIGYALACSIRMVSMGASMDSEECLLRFLLVTGVAVPGVVGIRALVRVVQDLMHWMNHGLRIETQRGPRTLVCGADYLGTLFLRQKIFNPTGQDTLEIIGLIDADEAKRGHRVHGIEVLGTYAELPILAEQHRIERVYLVDTLEPAQEAKLRESLAHLPIRLIRWQIAETDL